ncbi:MAG TPA: PIN domain-containing protein [Mycobacteriales bacterium]|nr:PIN domain-containing protein [Mycobacteriales bacterium]
MDTNEVQHSQCSAALATGAGLVVSPLVLAELDYLATKRVGNGALQPFYDDIAAGVYEVGQVSAATITAARELDTRYAQLGIGFADAVNIVLAHDYNTGQILTLDGHYRTVKPLTRHTAFLLLPADGS